MRQIAVIIHMPESVESRAKDLIVALLRYKRAKPDEDLLVKAHQFQRTLEDEYDLEGIEEAEEYDVDSD